jgi:hypothetical protein
MKIIFLNLFTLFVGYKVLIVAFVITVTIEPRDLVASLGFFAKVIILGLRGSAFAIW